MKTEIETKGQQASREFRESPREDYSNKIKNIDIMYKEELQTYKEFLGLQKEIERNKKILGNNYNLLERKIDLMANIYKTDLEILNNRGLMIQLVEEIDNAEKRDESSAHIDGLFKFLLNINEKNNLLDSRVNIYENEIRLMNGLSQLNFWANN